MFFDLGFFLVMIIKYHLKPSWDNFAKEKDHTSIIKVMEYHFTWYHFFCNNKFTKGTILLKARTYNLQLEGDRTTFTPS